MKKILMIIAVLAIMLTGCGEKTTEKITVVTTVFPAYDFARSIGGDAVELKLLVKPGGDVHSFEPSPSDIAAINQCDLFIYTGGENDSWVDTVLKSAKGIETLKMTDCVDIINEVHNHDGEEHTKPDEHVWTSPENAVKICNAINEKLCKASPGNKKIYTANTKKLTEEIESIDDEIAYIVNTSQRKDLIFADRFAMRYFTEYYGLKVTSAFPGCSGETEADPQTITEIIEKVKAEKIPVVLYGELSNTAMADTVCKETGAEKMLLHSCHNLTKEDFEAGKTYVDIMKDNAEVLREALGK